HHFQLGIANPEVHRSRPSTTAVSDSITVVNRLVAGPALDRRKASENFTPARCRLARINKFILDFSHFFELARGLHKVLRPLGSTPTQRGRQQRFSGPAFAVPF